jgi:transposase-like protein
LRWKMKGHGTKFGRKKEAAVAALLTHRNIEEAAKAVGIAPNTLLNWMKDREFAAAYRKARAAVVGQAIARLQQTTGAAVSTLQKLMVDANTPAAIKGNVARAVLALAIKGVEVEDLEARLADLERAAEETKHRR